VARIAKIRRLWRKDKSVWTGDDENKWLGWLTSAVTADVADYEDFARRVKGQVLPTPSCSAWAVRASDRRCWPTPSRTNPASRGCMCSNSTDPAQVRAMEAYVDIAKTLFIVSSKSGGTTEPNVMKDYFFDRVAKAIGKDRRPSLHRGDRSRLGAAEGRDQAGLCPHLLRRSRDRRPLFRPLPFGLVPAAAARHRRPQPARPHTLDGAFLRRRRAAA